MKNIILVTLLLFSTSYASIAQFYEDFDSYPAGQNLDGIGGWEPWADNPIFTAFTSNVESSSLSNSLLIEGNADILYQLTGINSGVWTVQYQSFVPTGFTGENIMVLLNRYNSDIININWSTEVKFVSASGTIVSENENASAPIVFDIWTPVRVVIDFDNDIQTIFYNDVMLSQKSWTDGFIGGGSLELSAIDFTSQMSSPVYYDDIELLETSAIPTLSQWGVLILFFMFLIPATITLKSRREGAYLA